MRDWIDIASIIVFVIGMTVMVAWAVTGHPEVASYLAQAF